MQRRSSAAVLAAFAAMPFAASTQMMGHDHSKMGMDQAALMSTAPKAVKQAEGEVRKVDVAKGTVLLKHGPLDALGMPPMTM